MTRAPTVPEVSVVIPTRNRWQLLGSRGLEAALRQEDVALEVVVVDDGSADAPTGVTRLGDPRVRVVRHPERLGVSRARNSGIAAAAGEWVAFLDDDDVWAPRKLREQIVAAERIDASFAYSAAVHVDERLQPVAAFSPPSPERLRRVLLHGTPIPAGASNVVARRTALEAAGGFDPELRAVEDHDFWIRLADVGRPAACATIHVGYVQHPGAAHLSGRNIVTAFDRMVRKYGADGFERDIRRYEARYLRWAAGQHRRAGRRLAAAGVYLPAARRHRDVRYLGRAVAQLAGERGIALGARMIPPRRPSRPPGPPAPGEQIVLGVEPAWLALYR